MPRGKKQTETATSFNPDEFDCTPLAAVQEKARQEQGPEAGTGNDSVMT